MQNKLDLIFGISDGASLKTANVLLWKSPKSSANEHSSSLHHKYKLKLFHWKRKTCINIIQKYFRCVSFMVAKVKYGLIREILNLTSLSGEALTILAAQKHTVHALQQHGPTVRGQVWNSPGLSPTENVWCFMQQKSDCWAAETFITHEL